MTIFVCRAWLLFSLTVFFADFSTVYCFQQFEDSIPITLSLIQQIGKLDADDENYLLHQPFDVGADSKGNYLILDAGNFRIQKFSSEGKYIDTFGGKGEGPGELISPMFMEIDSNDNIYVTDNYSNMIVLDSEGRELRRIRFEKNIVDFALNSVDKFVLSLFGSDSEADLDPFLYIFDAKGNPQSSFGALHDYKGAIKNSFGNLNYISLDTKDNIFVAFRSQNRIVKYSKNGQLLIQTSDFPLDFDYQPLDESITSGKGWKWHSDVARGIQIDNQNRVWVLRHKTENILKFDIYDEELSIVGTVYDEGIPKGRDFRIIGDKLFILDRYDTMSVFEFQIQN